MRTQMKLIIPFLDEEFSKEDFAPETGFLDAFTTDINRPYLDNCIFLMYDINTMSERRVDTMHKLMNLKSLYKTYLIRHNGAVYRIYAISILNPKVRQFKKGLRFSNYQDAIKCIEFWNFEEGDVNTIAFNPTSVYNYSTTSVPEEDYIPTEGELRQNKKAGVSIRKPQPLFVFY